MLQALSPVDSPTTIHTSPPAAPVLNPDQHSDGSDEEAIHQNRPTNRPLTGSNADTDGSRWERAEGRWLELFFGSTDTEGGGTAVKGFDSSGRPLVRTERVVNVSFDEAANQLIDIADGGNGSGKPGSGAQRRQEDALKRSTHGGKGRVVRPRTAELSNQQRKMLNEFRELDSYIFIRADELAAKDGELMKGRERLPMTSRLLSDTKAVKAEQADRSQSSTISVSELILPRNIRPLSRPVRKILKKLIDSATEGYYVRAPGTEANSMNKRSPYKSQVVDGGQRPSSNVAAPAADFHHVSCGGVQTLLLLEMLKTY
ncbi:hypothetical protein HDV00_011186 [Rhizophlyctis rosea]|nr:hypothetical protein HDV00_011186 [Rhizophlyctis rosea]